MSESGELNFMPWLFAGLAAHVAMILLARRIHPMFFVAGAFLLLAPLSLATDLEAVGLIKWLRLYTTVLLAALGIAAYRLRFGRGASAALLFFVAMYVAAGLYSSRPELALFYKGMFAMTVLAGVLLAQSGRTVTDLLRGLRWLGLVAGVAGIGAFVQYAMHPAEHLRVSRFALWGMNANTLGMTAAGLVILCVQLALYERSVRWRRFAVLVGALLTIEILATGSRGALLMASVGSVFVAMPFAKRPGRLAASGLFFGLAAYAALAIVDLYAVNRFADLKTTRRESVWRGAWNRFLQSPAVGHGWIDTGRGSTANSMNIYLQTLVETGILGGVVLAVCLGIVADRARRTHRLLRRHPGPLRNLSYLALGLTGAVLVHGCFESGTFLGSTINAFLLGFGVGLFDRLPELAAQEAGFYRSATAQPDLLRGAMPLRASFRNATGPGMA